MAEFDTSALRWTALTKRDPRASNAFIYSVITTKIYCRPTCPSRLARRANIVFHDTPAQAEADGFRACMRCKPGMLKGEDGDPQKVAIDRAKTLLNREDDGTRWSIRELAKEVGLTESHFCRVFKKLEGTTVGEYRSLIQTDATVVGGEGGTGDSTIVVPQKVKSSGELQEFVADQNTQWSVATTELDYTWSQHGGLYSTTFDHSYNVDGNLLGYNIDYGVMGDATPGLISDSSSPNPTDDGLQFLNFDDLDIPSYGA